MIPPCADINRVVLPEVRRRAALILKDRGMGQNEIAEALQVTQAMVSKYLKMEPRVMGGPVESYIFEMARELADGISAGKSRAELTEAFCRSCFRMRESGRFCSVHKVEDCRVCMNIRGTEEAGERSEAIRDVENAIRMLENMNLALIPEVRVNIARAIEGARGPNEIVAIPGRMVEIRGKLVALTHPEFGASRHLAGKLLEVMQERKDVRAVVNILYSDEIGTAIELAGLKEDAIIDEGGFGREPCAYILGRSATEAASRVMTVSEMVE